MRLNEGSFQAGQTAKARQGLPCAVTPNRDGFNRTQCSKSSWEDRILKSVEACNEVRTDCLVRESMSHASVRNPGLAAVIGRRASKRHDEFRIASRMAAPARNPSGLHCV